VAWRADEEDAAVNVLETHYAKTVDDVHIAVRGVPDRWRPYRW